eukprot:4886355-Amphidinium_carterae.1
MIACLGGNGYHENSPTIKWLWELLEKHLGPEDMANFLMFLAHVMAPLALEHMFARQAANEGKS